MDVPPSNANNKTARNRNSKQQMEYWFVESSGGVVWRMPQPLPAAYETRTTLPFVRIVSPDCCWYCRCLFLFRPFVVVVVGTNILHTHS